MSVIAVDLFCGIGGLTRGLQESGIPVALGYDIDSSCKYAYEFNNKTVFIERNLKTTGPSEINSIYGTNTINILAGCAPCQPFSQANVSSKKPGGSNWQLVNRMMEFASMYAPDVITMENVPRLLTHRNNETFNNFTLGLEKLNYKVSYSVVDANIHGTAQRRKRLVLYASKFGTITHNDNCVYPEGRTTVRSAIGNLRKISAGEECTNDRFHRARSLSASNLSRIKHTPEGGGFYDWPLEMQSKLECRSTKIGRRFTSAYGRMEWDKPAPTLTTHCTGLSNGRFGHPSQDRAISIREAGMIQGFDAKYIFSAPDEVINHGQVSKHIGNAVPPPLGYAIGTSILKHLKIRSK